MCLMQTDLPVPDGPRIIEIWLSGMPRLRPFRILLRPNALCTSMNSSASTAPFRRGLALLEPARVEFLRPVGLLVLVQGLRVDLLALGRLSARLVLLSRVVC